MVAHTLFGMLALSLDLDLVFSTNIHMILDTQVELQTLYFSLSPIFANVRWKLVESVLLYLTLITVISVLLLSVESIESQVPGSGDKQTSRVTVLLSCCGGGEDCVMRTETRANCRDWHAISNKTISPISHATTLSYSQLGRAGVEQ